VEVWSCPKTGNASEAASRVAARILNGMIDDHIDVIFLQLQIEIVHTAEVKCNVVIGFGLIVITGRHIRAARGLLGWAQGELAKKAKVALGTVRKMEGSDGPVGSRTDSLFKVVAVLEKAGVEFIDSGQPGVRMRA
jgi:hypothetical protein